MITNLRLLLKLPPAIRQQLFLSQPFPGSCVASSHGLINWPSPRPLSISAHLSKQGAKHKTMYKNAQPQVPKPQAQDLPTPQATPAITSTSNARPPPPLPRRTAPAYYAAPAPRPRPRPAASDWISIRFPRQDEILLYVAPNHTAFFLTSYAVSIAILVGTFHNATMISIEFPWYLKAVSAVSTISVASFATLFLLAPMKLIKSVTAVRQAAEAPTRYASHSSMPWKLRIEVKRAMPFAKAKVMELKSADQVVLDRSVPLVSQKIRFHSYDVKDSAWMTEKYASTGTLQPEEERGVARFQRRLVNVWPAIRRDVQRMFTRDQMAYMRIEGHGNFKLDLQHSHMLDGGNVLDKMVGTEADAKPGRGWRSFLVNVFGSK